MKEFGGVSRVAWVFVGWVDYAVVGDVVDVEGGVGVVYFYDGLGLAH